LSHSEGEICTAKKEIIQEQSRFGRGDGREQLVQTVKKDGK